MDSIQTRFLNAKRALFDKLYDNLNERQREAVYTVNGPLLILAGAGSGKTTVLANRISHIIKYGNAYYSDYVPAGMTEEKVASLENADSFSKEEIAQILSEYVTEPCPPWAILSITFTNKAANEMKERLAKLLNEEYANDIWAGTFHSVCLRILRKYGERLGYSSGFTIYDTDDSKKLISNCMNELQIDEKILPVKDVLKRISAQKNMLKTPEMFAPECEGDFKLKMVSSLYTLYQKKLKLANAVDFDDIIMQTVRLLSENNDVIDYYNRRFNYICVDEFQDTNFAQLEFVRLMSLAKKNIMVVGDDDQSIYKFRGATIENILNFEKTFKGAKIIKLEQNYRSTKNILNAANAVIKNNSMRRGKDLWTAGDEGDKIVVQKLENQNEEAKFIINKIMEMVIREKRKYSDFAILYRMNAQSNSIEQMFSRSGVAYRVVGGTRFYDRKEIKDIVSYLCVINNPQDNLRLRRIINEPKRKIGDATIRSIEGISDAQGISMFEVMENASMYPSICKSASKLRDFVNIIKELQEVSETEPLSVLFEKTIENTGYRQMLLNAGEEEADRLNNVRELVSNAVEYENSHEEATLGSFLEEAALLSDIDNYDSTSDAVSLMTIHSAKGLEFPVVFLPGMEEGLFPGTQSQMYPEEIEEERRLAYVAITRAKNKLFCTCARERLLFGRTQYNQISRFVSEIPDEYIETDIARKTEAIADRMPKTKKNHISKEFYTKSAVLMNEKRGLGTEKFSAGDRVQHMMFGPGTIISASPKGSDICYEVAFDNVGTKKLMAAFARLKAIK